MVQVIRETTSEYDYFVSTLISAVTRKLGKDYTARIYKVTKNNSLELDSLVLLKQGKNFAPNIYLQPYYEAYRQGETIDELADRLARIYESFTVPIEEGSFHYSFEEVKSNIVYRLVSFERNRKLLEKIPHIRYLDLAITYHCLVREDQDGIGTIRITNEHARQWGVTLEDIHKLAARNTKQHFPHCIKSMEEVMRTILLEELPATGDHNKGNASEVILTNSKEDGQPSMYILSNTKGINGAACLLYRKVLADFANQVQSDFYLFPSSIHEVILVPASDTGNRYDYAEMVREINETQVAKEEVLSDRVYYFSREKGLILLE